MLSDRFVITDAQWAAMEPHCLGKKRDPGRTGGDSRLFPEAVSWIARTGAPWRDLPRGFGNWNTIFKRVAQRSCKTDQSFASMIYVAAAIINSR